MALEEKDRYYVAVKIFLRREGKFFACKDIYGSWDLPGGRIRKDEFNAPMEQVIRRKMLEELGSGIEYKIGRPVVTMRHERVEDAPGNPTIRIFSVGYEADLLKGEPELSELFVESMWIDPENFQPEKYFTGGWLKGVQDYLELNLNNTEWRI